MSCHLALHHEIVRCPGVPRKTVRAELVIDDVVKYLRLIFFRFFETESVAVITMMISRYRVEVKEEPEFIGETFEERFARITAFESRLTTTYAMTSPSYFPNLSSVFSPLRVPLIFKKR